MDVADDFFEMDLTGLTVEEKIKKTFLFLWKPAGAKNWSKQFVFVRWQNRTSYTSNKRPWLGGKMGKDRHAVQRHSPSFGRRGILFGAGLFRKRRDGKGERVFRKSPQELRLAFVQRRESWVQKACRGKIKNRKHRPGRRGVAIARRDFSFCLL